MEILKRHLNDEQRTIASNMNGNVLVVAGPGSGKTRLLTHRVAYELRQPTKQPYKVLVLTFTNEAARELRSRLSKEIPRRTSSRVWCGTFHQFGHYLLRHHGHHIGIPRHFEVIDDMQSVDFLEQVLDDLAITGVNPQGLASTVSRFRNRVNVPDTAELGVPREGFQRIVERYAQLKAASGVLDFDDLIIRSSWLLGNHSHLHELIQDVYKSVYVDELQDTSLLQLEFLKLLYSSETSIFAVADEDQILYEWRDARLATITEYEQYFNARVEYLVQNYRSPQNIVDVANELIKHNQDRHHKKLVSAVTGRSARLAILKAATPAAEADEIAEHIRNRLSQGEISASQVAVLARFADPIRMVLRALIQKGVPAVFVGDRTISRSIGVRFVKCIIGVTAGSLDAEARVAKTLGNLERTVRTEICTPESLARIIDSHKHLAASAFVESIINELSLNSLLDETNRHYLSVATQVVRIAELGGYPRDYASINAALTLEWNRLERMALRDDHSVRLMTIHQAKGLEFGSVFLPRLEEGIIPVSRSKNIPEERRLLFVAITRAKEELVFSLCKVNDRGWDAAPSRFLQEIPLYEFKDLSR